MNIESFDFSISVRGQNLFIFLQPTLRIAINSFNQLSYKKLRRKLKSFS